VQTSDAGGTKDLAGDFDFTYIGASDELAGLTSVYFQGAVPPFVTGYQASVGVGAAAGIAWGYGISNTTVWPVSFLSGLGDIISIRNAIDNTDLILGVVNSALESVGLNQIKLPKTTNPVCGTDGNR
jgi:hypothetical protein